MENFFRQTWTVPKAHATKNVSVIQLFLEKLNLEDWDNDYLQSVGCSPFGVLHHEKPSSSGSTTDTPDSVQEIGIPVG